MITGARPLQWWREHLSTACPMRTWRERPKSLRNHLLCSAGVLQARFWAACWASSLCSRHSPFCCCLRRCGGTRWIRVGPHARVCTSLSPSSCWCWLSRHGLCFWGLRVPPCHASSSSAACCWRSSSSSWLLTGCSTVYVCWSHGSGITAASWDTLCLLWTRCSSFSTWPWCCWKCDTCDLPSASRWCALQTEPAASTTSAILGKCVQRQVSIPRSGKRMMRVSAVVCLFWNVKPLFKLYTTAFLVTWKSHALPKIHMHT